MRGVVEREAGGVGVVGRVVTWAKVLLGLEPKVLKRSEWPRNRPGTPSRSKVVRAVTSDEVCVRVNDLAMWVRSSSELDVPYELTVVVPRVEIRKRYVDGKLAEVISSYSSVTIARSPRPEPVGSQSPSQKAIP